MERELAGKIIVEAKRKLGLKWADIAKVIDRSEAWTASALLGQATLSNEEAEQVASLLELDQEVAECLTEVPYRGTTIQMPPTDPLLYRFYEMLLVYGPGMKEIIHEKFGDGIMSAIDFEMDIKRVPDPKGDRVLMMLNGKFLPYKKF
ncbi:cyanate hydratase CynS [Paenibacillus larvae subsp. larvae]|uniref:Cyanate hydratase n=1 Tax=Paenibacillus larvae subsp. larvae TaxID=147375 RepID=A0A2L1UDQ9_9BACL|nr:cyanase [Paenibacillus larvae]AQZ48312.1 cyanase [Paenibacillus larvae subsp. pulvifaciens]AVF26293.1 cyanate hydratase CynS [Paenibacillus larvae subsp. larvae]AVF31070.1 cyanate hydratase CynS [Paenibacillus larvae subsp. larvae]MBH0343674.1 cyanate hydratase [Paenibacillus larvae]MCY7521715.1 cyanase [Paenibacillus larvae]